MLWQAYPEVPPDERGWSPFAFRPGFINFIGSDPTGPETLLAAVTAGAAVVERMVRMRCELVRMICGSYPEPQYVLEVALRSSNYWRMHLSSRLVVGGVGHPAQARQRCPSARSGRVLRPYPRLTAAPLPADAGLGEHKLRVTSTVALRQGQWVRLTMSDPAAEAAGAGSLITALYGGAPQVQPKQQTCCEDAEQRLCSASAHHGCL